MAGNWEVRNINIPTARSRNPARFLRVAFTCSTFPTRSNDHLEPSPVSPILKYIYIYAIRECAVFHLAHKSRSVLSVGGVILGKWFKCDDRNATRCARISTTVSVNTVPRFIPGPGSSPILNAVWRTFVFYLFLSPPHLHTTTNTLLMYARVPRLWIRIHSIAMSASCRAILEPQAKFRDMCALSEPTHIHTTRTVAEISVRKRFFQIFNLELYVSSF